MTVNVMKEYLRRSPEREASAFVVSQAFLEFCGIAVNVFPGNWAASFLDLTLDEDMLLSWVEGRKGNGMSMAVVKEEDVRTNNGGEYILRKGSIFPELKLLNDMGRPSKAIEQITLLTGRYSLSSYTLPADVVVDRSGLLLSVKYDHVSMSRSGVNLETKDTLGIKAHADGGFSCYERGEYNPNATKRLNEAIRTNEIYRALGIVS